MTRGGGNAIRKEVRTIPFDKLFGHFQVRQGVFHTNYLNMQGPELTANGRGNIDLRQGDIDIAIEAAYKQLLAIPIAINGKLAKPDVAVDMEDMVFGTTDKVMDLPWKILDRVLAADMVN